ncbi:MAG: hypothetical protein Q7U57_05315 [Methylovulum sp.]|nr:hypothetical protein [Methylovulum sp.]
MRISNILLALVLMATAGQAWAYGSSSSSKKACAKPKFTEFKPVNNAQVAPASTFSFLASPGTNPDSLVVTVKGQAVELTLTPQNQSLLVQGQLPANVTGDFARISISAEGVNQCKGSDGWLVKVE